MSASVATPATAPSSTDLSADAPVGTTTGALGAWGLDGEYGALRLPPGEDFVAVDGSGYTFAGLRADGTMTAWNTGYDEYDVAGWAAQQTDVLAVAVGGGHGLALHADGTVSAGGLDHRGQATVPDGLTDVVEIAAGGGFSMALRSDGTVVAWGDDDDGQTDVPADLTDVVTIAAGGAHALAVRADGSVVAWGNDRDGQADVPEGLSEVIDVDADYDFTVAALADGSVVAWGSDSQGQTAVPAGLTGVVDVEAGSNHTLALRSDGTVVAWGGEGDVGVGQTAVPAGLTDVVDIAAGAAWGLVVTAQVDGPLPDTTAPIIDVPAEGYITKAATSTRGARVWATATATDAVFGDLPAYCGWYRGNWFPLGKTEVSCDATDWAGNRAHASYTVDITYTWSGLRAPVKPDGTTVRERSRNLPLSFALTGSSTGITDARATVSYAPITDGEVGEYTNAQATGTSGNRFVYDDGLYRFTWKTSELEKGTYSVRVDLGDEEDRTVRVRLN